MVEIMTSLAIADHCSEISNKLRLNWVRYCSSDRSNVSGNLGVPSESDFFVTYTNIKEALHETGENANCNE